MIFDCDANCATIVQIQRKLMIDRKKIFFFLFENLNFQLIKIIEFKKYERKIDENFFRSIIRVKRF